jgi:hypothetical protein
MSTWNRKVEESIRAEKKEAEARYGSRIGRTEIYCARCGKSWGFNHTCQDIRFKALREAQKEAIVTDNVPRSKSRPTKPYALKQLSLEGI